MPNIPLMTWGLMGVTTAYVVVAVLLLSLNVASRWLWWVKAGAIVVTTVFFVFSYTSVSALIGWPSRDRVPHSFQLHWAKIVEPNKFYNEPGAIFLWLEELDANNVPIGTPRAYRMRYSKDLADQLAKAQEQIKEGKEVAGTAEMMEEGQEEDNRDQNLQARERREGDQAGGFLPENFATDMMTLTFTEMPDVIMPEKTPF